MAATSARKIGVVLTRFREAAGLSIEAVAERMGVRRSQVAKYEADLVNVPDHRVDAFARAVGVLPAELELECLFHVNPALRGKSIGRLLKQTTEEIRQAMDAADGQPPRKPAVKPTTRTPPRRRVSR